MSKESLNVQISDIESAPHGILKIEFDDVIDGIESKGNFKSELELISLGEFIQVKGSLKGTAVLQCDLCLEDFNYSVDIHVDELFTRGTLYEEYSQETELKEGQFVTDLEGAEFIDICDLLYQSVIIDFPNKKVCGINCKGGDIFIRDESPQPKETDPRLEVFKNLKIDGTK